MAENNNTVKVGIIGCGNIAPAYMRGCGQFPILEVAGCADIDTGRAQAFAAKHGITAYPVSALLDDPEIEIILNLTVPNVHAEVSLAAIDAGKHIYSEKPLATTYPDGIQIIEAAAQAGVRVGCAPDTFLGGGGQTCRKLIDEGAIGKPVAATAFLLSRGPESWHPNPDFFYLHGGGPLFDMGPYYLTTLINLLGPVERVAAVTRASFPERIASSEAQQGRRLKVEVNTHVAGTLDFTSGAVATVIMSFDVWAHHLPRIEIYGAKGSLSVPDPNTFGGPVSIWQPQEESAWREVPLTHSAEVGRGIGVADMAYALRSGRQHRANGEVAFHVLEIMDAFDESSVSGLHAELESICKRPASLPVGLPPGTLDE